MTKKQPATNCEQCEHYVYDDLMEYYVCEVDLDQDEMEDFLNYNTHLAPTTALPMSIIWPINNRPSRHHSGYLLSRYPLLNRCPAAMLLRL